MNFMTVEPEILSAAPNYTGLVLECRVKNSLHEPLLWQAIPVYRDTVGAIGSPTSDVERTKLSLETSRLLMVLHSAEGSERLDEALDWSEKLLMKHVFATELNIQRF